MLAKGRKESGCGFSRIFPEPMRVNRQLRSVPTWLP
jgi:hypothetical protein